MGNVAARVSSLFQTPREVRILIVGLDASGKTTVLYKMARGRDSVATTIPTIGFNVETLRIRSVEMTAWDVGGRDKIRPLWRHYYQNTDGIVFVVDSNDLDRVEQAKTELQIHQNEDELKGLPILLLCNKQDLPNALPPEEIACTFGVSSNKNVYVVGCVATKGEGLREGFDWLTDSIRGKGDLVVEESGDKKDTAVARAQIIQAGKGDNDDWKQLTSAGGNSTLQKFDPIKKGTECPFAKASKLWGGTSVELGSSLEDQARANAAALSEFVRKSNAGQPLDGFCIELDDPSAREGGPEELGECVRRLLSALSDLDPAGDSMMHVGFVGSRGWRFRFGGADFFVTTFAPCYPPTSSRFAFGAGAAFVLLQPEASFARRDLPPDTAATRWDDPETIRDETRAAYKKAGRAYHIPDTTRYPPAEHIVKPLVDDGAGTVYWWQAVRVGADDLPNSKRRM